MTITLYSKTIRETPGNIHKHLYESRRDIRVDNLNNALVQQISKSDHTSSLMQPLL